MDQEIKARIKNVIFRIYESNPMYYDLLFDESYEILQIYIEDQVFKRENMAQRDDPFSVSKRFLNWLMYAPACRPCKKMNHSFLRWLIEQYLNVYICSYVETIDSKHATYLKYLNITNTEDLIFWHSCSHH